METEGTIAFLYYHSKGIGGAEQLIINLTAGLNERGIKPKIYCYRDSFIYNRLYESDASFIFIDANIITLTNIDKQLDITDTYIMFGISALTLRNLISANPKLIVYLIHPETFLLKNRFFNILMSKKIKSLFNKCIDLNGLYFMDYSTYKTPNDAYKLSINSLSFLPIPTNTKNEVQYNTLKTNSKKIIITYIGRGDTDWKVYPALKIYYDLLLLHIEFELQIITNTITLFKEMFKKCFRKDDLNSVRYIVGLQGDSLSEYLCKNSDLHFSMGTAALEGAKLGIPTILMDVIHTYFPDNYRYRWIYTNNTQYNLGFVFKASDSFSGLKMSDIISIYESKETIKDISVKCFKYVLNNHSIENTVDQLITACNNSRLTVKEFCDTNYFKTLNNYLKFRSLFRVLRKFFKNK